MGSLLLTLLKNKLCELWPVLFSGQSFAKVPGFWFASHPFGVQAGGNQPITHLPIFLFQSPLPLFHYL